MSKPRNIRKKWRDLEKVVAKVEELKRGPDAVVTWDDSVKSKRGVPRQIDVTVRTRSEEQDILTMIECQRRGRKSGVMWVDSVVGKRQTLPADEAIMVSHTGFSEAARLTAEDEGIETRILREIGPESIPNMFPNRFEYHQPTTRLESIRFHLRDSVTRSSADELRQALVAEEPVWIVFPDGERALLRDAAEEAVAAAPLPEIKPDFVSKRCAAALLPVTIPVELEFLGTRVCNSKNSRDKSDGKP